MAMRNFQFQLKGNFWRGVDNFKNGWPVSDLGHIQASPSRILAQNTSVILKKRGGAKKQLFFARRRQANCISYNLYVVFVWWRSVRYNYTNTGYHIQVSLHMIIRKVHDLRFGSAKQLTNHVESHIHSTPSSMYAQNGTPYN